MTLPGDSSLAPGVSNRDLDAPQPICPGCGSEYTGEAELCEDCAKDNEE